ncbi:MAG: metal ABC transporter ATP-binding protein [Caldilineaceae bacterium]
MLDDINLHLHSGQFAAIVGPSGAGKTSLLKLVLGLLHTPHGKIQLSSDTQQRPSRTPRLSYVPQVDEVDWNFPVTVQQVVWMGRPRPTLSWPWPSRAEKQRVRDVLAQLEIDHLADQHIRNLSGGQQQRVFLARALVAQPDLLVLDEPTSGVDMRTAENMLHLLLDLNQEGMTILMTTHDLNMAAAHVPWVICLNKRIIAQGAPEMVFTEPILNETYQGDMMVLHHNGLLLVHQRPHGHTRDEVLPNPIPGHEPGYLFPTTPLEESRNGSSTPAVPV